MCSEEWCSDHTHCLTNNLQVNVYQHNHLMWIFKEEDDFDLSQVTVRTEHRAAQRERTRLAPQLVSNTTPLGSLYWTHRETSLQVGLRHFLRNVLKFLPCISHCASSDFVTLDGIQL